MIFIFLSYICFPFFDIMKKESEKLQKIHISMTKTFLVIFYFNCPILPLLNLLNYFRIYYDLLVSVGNVWFLYTAFVNN